MWYSLNVEVVKNNSYKKVFVDLKYFSLKSGRRLNVRGFYFYFHYFQKVYIHMFFMKNYM